MNRGLITKSVRDIGPVTLGYGLLLMLAETIIAFVLPQVQSGGMLNLIFKLPFARTLISALLGSPVTGEMAPLFLHAVPWIHPLVLLLIFAHVVTVATQLPAGEIDRGTIELLLGLPVSRWNIYCAHGLGLAFAGPVVLALGLLGNRIGTSLGHGTPAAGLPPLMIQLNACALFLAVGSLGLLVSSACDRRGRAGGILIAAVVLSFLLNFIAEYWPPARHLNFVSVLNYYRPFVILQSARWPAADLASLLGATIVFWLAGAALFRHRDIHAL